ncbi:hypothetical protein LINPERHAP2_LOCUS21905 [Linum perenne]
MAMNRPSCGCGQMAVIRTSWTESNPGRRFFGCGRYGRVGACKFFHWADPELDEHVKHIVVGLLWKIRDIERVNRRPNIGDRYKKLGYVLISICVILSIVMLSKM